MSDRELIRELRLSAAELSVHYNAKAKARAELMEKAAERLADLYALGLLAEEMGETIQLVGKWLRFGPDHARSDGETARALLPTEMGDASAAIDFACLDGLVSFDAVVERHAAKKAKLLNPDSRDDEGRRLAPEPRGQRFRGGNNHEPL